MIRKVSKFDIDGLATGCKLCRKIELPNRDIRPMDPCIATEDLALNYYKEAEGNTGRMPATFPSARNFSW